MPERLPKAPRQLIAIDLFSDIGNQLIALFLVDRLVFKSDGAVSSLVLLYLIHQLPALILGPPAGQCVDRLGPRRWMMAVNLFKCLLAGAFALASGRPAFLSLYLLFVSASLFFTIGRLSFGPLLMPGDRILRFNAVNERVAIGGAILAPWLIGIVLAKNGSTAALGVAALIFAGTVLLLTAIPDPRQPAVATGTQKGKFAGRCLESNRGFPAPDCAPQAVFLMLGLVILGGGFLNLGLPLLFKNSLEGDIGRWGFVLSAFQAGAFISTLLLPRCFNLLRKKSAPAAGFLTLSAAMFLLPRVSGHIQLAVLMVVFGCGLTLLQLFCESRLQQISRPAAIGRTMSLMSAFKGGCYLTAVLCGALVSSFWGADSFLMLGAVVLGSASLIVRRI